jgi:hypothetical protein
MRLLRQALGALRLRREPPAARYGSAVLLAGWVELPAAFHEFAATRGRTRFKSRLKST